MQVSKSHFFYIYIFYPQISKQHYLNREQISYFRPPIPWKGSHVPVSSPGRCEQHRLNLAHEHFWFLHMHFLAPEDLFGCGFHGNLESGRPSPRVILGANSEKPIVLCGFNVRTSQCFETTGISLPEPVRRPDLFAKSSFPFTPVSSPGTPPAPALGLTPAPLKLGIKSDWQPPNFGLSSQLSPRLIPQRLTTSSKVFVKLLQAGLSPPNHS